MAEPIDKRFARGLVVGKFAPLHRGHMHLIQSAIDACAEVLVISYTKPEFAGHGPAARAAWLQAVFPQVRSLVVDDAWLADWSRTRGLRERRRLPHNDDHAAVPRAFTAWLCPAICGTTVDAVTALPRPCRRISAPARAGRTRCATCASTASA